MGRLPYWLLGRWVLMLTALGVLEKKIGRMMSYVIVTLARISCFDWSEGHNSV